MTHVCRKVLALLVVATLVAPAGVVAVTDSAANAPPASDAAIGSPDGVTAAHLTPERTDVPSLANDDVVVYVSDNASEGIGTYTLQTGNDSAPLQDLLYGNTYTGTNYMTVQVDGTNYTTADVPNATQMNRYVTQTPTVVGDTIVTRWSLPSGVEVTQNVSLAGELADWDVDVRNTDGQPHDVNVRLLFDYQVADQDGSPVFLQGQVLTNETRVEDPSFNEWRTYDAVPNPSLVGRHTLTTQPTAVAFVDWRLAFGAPYAYAVNTSHRFFDVATSSGDSAGLLYYEFGSLDPGEAASATTSYGTGQPGTPAERLNLEFSNQTSDGASVVVDSVYLPDGGFLAVRNASGATLGASAYLSVGTHENVTVPVSPPLTETQTLTAVAHRDSNDNQTFDYLTSAGSADGPYTAGGDPVTADAVVTVGGPAEPAFFDVSNLSAPANVTQGDPVTVTADVTNTGGTNATQSVEFRFEGTALANETVSLDAGESRAVTFTVDGTTTAGLAPGTYTHGVFSDDDEETAQLTVEAPPGPAFFDVSNLSAPATVTQGDPVNVSADVTNTGGSAATQTVEFRFDGSPLLNTTVTLDPGQTAPVELRVAGPTTAGIPPGTYTHGIFTEDDEETAEITVEAAGQPGSFFAVSDLVVPANVTQGDPVTVSATVTNTGDEAGTGPVAFAFDGETFLVDTVTLSPGESTTFAFTVPGTVTASVPTGDHELSVTTPDDAATAPFTVLVPTPPGVFTVTDLSVPANVTQGESLTIEATVTNTGSQAATGVVTFALDGDASLNQSVTLDPNESVTVAFTLPGSATSRLSTGTHVFAVRTPDDAAAADFEVLAPPGPAYFDVSDLSAPATITQGDAVPVTANVTNTGGEAGTQTVEFRFEGTVLADQTVTLAPEETTEVVFVVSRNATADLAPGTYTHGVFSEDDEETAELTVEAAQAEPAFFDVSALSVPANVSQGESVTVSATVTNTGDEAGTQDVSLTWGVLPLDETPVSLDPGESTTYETTVSAGTTAAIPPGEYEVTVASEDDDASATVTVVRSLPLRIGAGA
ncbi:MAG: CARDB domain-containing protein [Halobacteriaceae archaeon]